jgi:D-sedoheptulose 7-phosphate isomerase
MKNKILKAFKDSISVKENFVHDNVEAIEEVSRLIAKALNDGKKLILFGNGGSSSDASHIAAEFVGRSRKERPGLNAISLSGNAAVMTALANDYDYSEIFSRQLKAVAESGDVVIAISTTGNSSNVIKAVDVAKRKKLKTVAFTGAKGGKLASKVNYALSVPSSDTPRVQETHITLGHVLCQMVEEILFEAPRKKRK